MPGISFVDNPPGQTLMDSALESVRFLDSYNRNDILWGDQILSTTAYDHYPLQVVEIDDWTLVLEGYLYDADNTTNALSDVARLVNSNALDRLREWVIGTDGDFLIVAVNRETGKSWALNDVFGRLPTYAYTSDGTSVLSRELKIIRELGQGLQGGLDPDRIGLGQMLLFGYPLGNRTLFENVSTLSPGTLYDINTQTHTSLYEHQFDGYGFNDQPVNTNARMLRDHFVTACTNRAGVVDDVVVSLSGGLDSRAVIAGFSHVDGRVSAATSLRKDGRNATEVDVARQVASVLGVPWNSYVADWTDHHQELLLQTKQGMNTIEMAVGLDFVEQVSQDYDEVMFLTGDGGDKALPDLTPTTNLGSTEELVDHILTVNHAYPVSDAAALAGISRDDLIDSIYNRVTRYPETSPKAKYVHFRVRERGMNWLNHGEDRSRYYLWSTTPFYSLPFFLAAMGCPPAQKTDSQLYNAFLQLLSPATAQVEYYNFGAQLGSLEYRLKRRAYAWLDEHPGVKAHILGLLSRRSYPSEKPVRTVADKIDQRNTGTSVIPQQELNRIVTSLDKHSNKQLYILLTVLSVMDYEVESVKNSILL